MRHSLLRAQLRPGKLVRWKTSGRIEDDDPRGTIRPPLPQDKILIGGHCLRREAGNKKTGIPIGSQALGYEPGRSVVPFTLACEPSTGEIFPQDAMALSPRLIAQVGNLLAVDFIFTHEEGSQSMAEPLCAFSDRSHDIQGKVKRRFSLPIKTTAGDGRPFPGQRRERPRRIMASVTASLKSQAKPPSAR